MSPKNEVLPLSFLCLKYASNIIMHVLSDDEGKYYETVDSYLADATYEVAQDLLKVILNAENLDASTRFNCLQVLLREDIRRLDTGVFPNSYYENILETLTAKCGALEYLNLKGVWVREHPLLLSALLKKLRKLKVLIMPHIPDDAVLESAMTWNSLSVLDISGDCAFTEDGLKKLKSESLKVLCIGMYGKREICQGSNSVDAVADLIMRLPNLTVLKIYSYVGSALLKIHQRSRNHKTKLTYIHDTETTPETFDAIRNLCPDLSNVHFNAPEGNVLSKLGDLRRLTSVKLSRPNFGDLLCYLQTSGSRVHTLKLNSIKGASVDVSEICLLAQDLSSLECFKLSLTCSQPDSYFMNLQSIEILYCDVSNDVLRYLLMNAPFLKRVVVGDVIRMTDGDIFRICAECDFKCLEELWFSSARGLTVTSVELLMGHCPNLKVIGQLSGWDVTASDMDYLRAVILSTNVDLTLLPVGAFP